MGYTTKFTGQINLSRPLTITEAKALLTFADDSDTAPKPNPGGYLQWVPSQSLDAIGWDGNEKFYDYVEWLMWVCAWLKSAGIACNGRLVWSGEMASDTGEIIVIDNEVTATKGKTAPAGFNPLTLEGLARIALDQVTK
jgi:hypothetical protein